MNFQFKCIHISLEILNHGKITNKQLQCISCKLRKAKMVLFALSTTLVM